MRSNGKTGRKQTYFKKYPSDQFNFYKPVIKDIVRSENIFDLTCQKTERLHRSVQRSKLSQTERKPCCEKTFLTFDLKNITTIASTNKNSKRMSKSRIFDLS